MKQFKEHGTFPKSIVTAFPIGDNNPQEVTERICLNRASRFDQAINNVETEFNTAVPTLTALILAQL